MTWSESTEGAAGTPQQAGVPVKTQAPAVAAIEPVQRWKGLAALVSPSLVFCSGMNGVKLFTYLFLFDVAVWSTLRCPGSSKLLFFVSAIGARTCNTAQAGDLVAVAVLHLSQTTDQYAMKCGDEDDDGGDESLIRSQISGGEEGRDRQYGVPTFKNVGLRPYVSHE